jgi:hypothetical protein
VPREKPLTCDREKSSRTCGPHACALARVSRERLESRSEFPMRIFEVRRLSRAVVFGRVGLFVSFFGRFSVLSERDARERDDGLARLVGDFYLGRARTLERLCEVAPTLSNTCVSLLGDTHETRSNSRERSERETTGSSGPRVFYFGTRLGDRAPHAQSQSMSRFARWWRTQRNSSMRERFRRAGAGVVCAGRGWVRDAGTRARKNKRVVSVSR